MRTVLFAQLRTHAARLIASTLAIVIAVGFVVATLVLNQTARATVLESIGARYVGAAAVVTSVDGASLTDVVDDLEALGSVWSVDPSWEVSVQASVVELLLELQKASGTAYLFITHDLNLIRQIAHRIAVMYRGDLIEVVKASEIDSPDRAEYTRRLIEAVPRAAAQYQ